MNTQLQLLFSKHCLLINELHNFNLLCVRQMKAAVVSYKNNQHADFLAQHEFFIEI